MRIVFMGSPEFAIPSLLRLVESEHEVVAVYTQPDRPAGRSRRLRPPPVKDLALHRGLPVRQPEKIGNAEVVAEMRSLAPDVAVIAAFGQILPKAVLDIPRCGTVNVHPSLLPRHRGAAPVAGAILAGDSETGVTLILTVAALDAGPILARRNAAINPDDTTGSLTSRLAELGAGLLLETLPTLAAGEITPQPQDESLATYVPAIRKQDALIDWSLPAGTICRRVRAFNPWPMAHTYVKGDALRILEARVVEELPAAAPGTAIAWGRGFAVACGENALEPLIVQKAGRRPMSGADFLRGQRDLVGLRLGE